MKKKHKPTKQLKKFAAQSVFLIPRERKNQLEVFRGEKLIGSLNRDTLKLETEDAELLSAFKEATTEPGMFELGYLGQPESPPGIIADYAHYTILKPGDLDSQFDFARFLRRRNLRVEGL